jgi:hypothetical protein
MLPKGRRCQAPQTDAAYSRGFLRRSCPPAPAMIGTPRAFGFVGTVSNPAPRPSPYDIVREGCRQRLPSGRAWRVTSERSCASCADKSNGARPRTGAETGFEENLCGAQAAWFGARVAPSEKSVGRRGKKGGRSRPVRGRLSTTSRVDSGPPVGILRPRGESPDDTGSPSAPLPLRASPALPRRSPLLLRSGLRSAVPGWDGWTDRRRIFTPRRSSARFGLPIGRGFARVSPCLSIRILPDAAVEFT